jgi:hypothetical protein
MTKDKRGIVDPALRFPVISLSLSRTFTRAHPLLFVMITTTYDVHAIILSRDSVSSWQSNDARVPGRALVLGTVPHCWIYEVACRLSGVLLCPAQIAKAKMHHHHFPCIARADALPEQAPVQ